MVTSQQAHFLFVFYLEFFICFIYISILIQTLILSVCFIKKIIFWRPVTLSDWHNSPLIVVPNCAGLAFPSFRIYTNLYLFFVVLNCICICISNCICIGIWGRRHSVTDVVPNQAVGRMVAFPRYRSHTNAAPIPPNQSRASCTYFPFFLQKIDQ